MDKKQLQKCKDIFEEIDTNHSGGIDCFELLDAIRKFNSMITMEEIHDTFSEFDLNQNSEIDFDEFITVISKFINKIPQEDSEESIKLIYTGLIQQYLDVDSQTVDHQNFDHQNFDHQNIKIPLQIILDYLETFELDTQTILEKIHYKYTNRDIDKFYNTGLGYTDFKKIFLNY